jgi:hypothetical protein
MFLVAVGGGHVVLFVSSFGTANNNGCSILTCQTDVDSHVDVGRCIAFETVCNFRWLDGVAKAVFAS